MIQFLKELWASITHFLFPQQYFAWQTAIYLSLFSVAMSWVADLSDTTAFTQWLLTTGSWIFFAIGVGWALQHYQINLGGIPLAPWVTGAILCVYGFDTLFGNNLALTIVLWPLISVGIITLPTVLTWEFRPKRPDPTQRQQLILLGLLGLLLSSWLQFYFRLQTWFDNYPTLLADDFSNSGFVFRLPSREAPRPGGIALLTSAAATLEAELDQTPWSWVERSLLNRQGQTHKLWTESQATLDSPQEQFLWELKMRRPRSTPEGYAVDLVAVWRGPTAAPEGYYLQKTCKIHREMPPPDQTQAESEPPPTAMAQVRCDLETPKKFGIPEETSG